MKNKLVLFVMIFLIILSNTTSFADDTVVKEDGQSIEFQLVESTPQNLSVDVALDAEIKLLFNKNVVNMTVKENNLKCIKLTDAKGEAVAVDLIFPDDQIEPDRKREIIIKPNEPLNENETYKVEISADMQAKNGSVLGEPAFVSFTTVLLSAEQETEEDVQPVEQSTENNSQIEVNATVNNDASLNNVNNNKEETGQENISDKVLTASSDDNSLNLNSDDSKNEDSEENEEKSISNESADEDTEENKEENKKADDEKTNNNSMLAAIIIVAAIIGAFAFIKVKKR